MSQLISVWNGGLFGGADLALRGTLLLATAWLAAVILRRHASSLRHLVWLAALVAVILLPLVQNLVPRWRIFPPESPIVSSVDSPALAVALNTLDNPMIGASEFHSGHLERTTAFNNLTALHHLAAEANPVGQPETTLKNKQLVASMPAPSVRTDWSRVRQSAGVIWLTGIVVFCLPIVLGTLQVRRLHRSSLQAPSDIVGEVASLRSEMRLSRSIDVVLSGERNMPMTWGLISPVILLPEAASTWSHQRLRMVLSDPSGKLPASACLIETEAGDFWCDDALCLWHRGGRTPAGKS